MMTIVCMFCGGTDCEHGDHCADCGCPECGYPGALYEEPDGYVRGFCSDPSCDWEAAPGAYRAWVDRQPVLTLHQMWRSVLRSVGSDLPPDDEVGTPIFDDDDNNKESDTC